MEKGEDNTEYYHDYMVTHDLEPICLNEYCIGIANYSSTRVLCIQSVLEYKDISDINRRYTEIKNDFNEFILLERPGRRRLTFFKDAPICSIRQFDVSKQILIPYHFLLDEDNSLIKVNWKNNDGSSIPVSNVALDLRTED